MTEAKTVSPLETAVHSIARIHQLGGEPSPTEHPLVKSILAGAQRFFGPPHYQEGANHCLSAGTISYLQGRCDGFFI